MPHECTSCGLTFPDGSKEMLSGCPDCGGNKFQFHPGGASSDETSSHSTDSSFTLGSLRSKDGSDVPNVSSEPSPEESKASESIDSSGDDASPATEDHAQTSARSTVASGNELHKSDSSEVSHPVPSNPNTSQTAPEGIEDETTGDAGATGDVPDQASDSGDVPDQASDTDPPDISELREELNDQFESIKIHAPGEYELNLMELYDREEHIIALQEDGRYVIDVPSSWREADEEERSR